MNISSLIVIVLVAAVANLVEAREIETNRGGLARLWPWGNSIGRHQKGNAPESRDSDSGYVADDERNEELNSRNQESLQASMDSNAENVQNTGENNFNSRNERVNEHVGSWDPLTKRPPPREVVDSLRAITNGARLTINQRRIAKQDRKFNDRLNAFNGIQKKRGIRYRRKRHQLYKQEEKMLKKKAKYNRRSRTVANRLRRIQKRHGPRSGVTMPSDKWTF